MSRRALVSQSRMPEPDRDRGSGRVDTLLRFLLDDGWSVTFLADDEGGDDRHARRLRQLGVATFAGYANAADVVDAGDFDLALVAFWQQSSRLLPVLRERSPRTRVIVDSIDVHFLRDARRRFGIDGRLDAQYGAQLVDELNTYRAADAVLAVSVKEAQLLGDLLATQRVEYLPLGERTERSAIPFDERRGLLFVGNFRHLPNGEAVEYLCRDVLPRVDPGLLAEHPLTVVGNRLDDKVRAHAAGLPHVRMVGWVPAIEPYLQRARASVVPLLHGAGVKGKVVQSMLTGTPVVTTSIGAEGLDLVDGEHAAIADTPTEFAAATTRLLTDADAWHRLADRGRDHLRDSYDPEAVRARFRDIVDAVLAAPAQQPDERFRGGRQRAVAYRGEIAAARRIVAERCDAGAVVLVTSRGDDELVRFDGCTGWHFPQDSNGAWAGYHPADSEAAVRHLEALRERGARYLLLPSSAFWWLHHYEGFAAHLDGRYRRLHADGDAVVYDLRAASPARVETHGEWTVTIDDGAEVAPEVVADLVAVASRVGADRAQPAHHAGPEAGPPVSERLLGCTARELSGWLPLPVRAVRAGAPPDGPVLLVDEVPIGLARPIDAPAAVDVLDVFVGDTRAVRRHGPAGTPRISVLVATYDRPDLLAGCLDGFCAQTLDADAFEVVVVDDGSPGTATAAVLDGFAARLPLVTLRLEHAGRAAAKNAAVMVARGDLVLFFDDDDRPAPDLLAAHVRAHDAAADPTVAILGHTDWAPELSVTPLMHYLTDVDKLLFAYGNLIDGQELDWRGFWEGRVSCDRSFLLAHGLHDQRLPYSIDVELAWRLARHGLRVRYDASARSTMARSIDVEQFCERIEAKGRAHAQLAALHDDPEIRAYTKVDAAAEQWAAGTSTLDASLARIRTLEAAPSDNGELAELHRLYREVFATHYAKGAGRPALTVTIPVWSRTEELAEMAARTIERVWEVARLPTEVVVVDNGSPFERRLRAEVLRFDTNRGVAVAWNAGIARARAPVVAVLNSDCMVEPGWDEALYEAVLDGRRIAFPFTDHADGLGFRRPDQAGTAGWCFMLTTDVYREIGPFDEQFSPAYCEDTDYWHRAWELGVELSPVPAARVVHARRTTGRTDPHVEWLLQSHRYKYGWKHGVDPLRAPPYYGREIVDYVPS